MTKRLNSKHKVDRRLRVNLWGRPKSPFNTRAYPPGQHGQSKSSKPSDYGIQLSAKQKLNELNKIDFRKKVAFLFGSEASGLSNNEISFSNYALQIPSNPNFKSLNLSHSLIIVAQALFQLLNMKKSKYSRSKKIRSASKKNIQAMTNLCVRHLEEINFFKPKEKKPKMLENLRSIFYKMDLSEKETRILSSVFANLAKKKAD